MANALRTEIELLYPNFMGEANVEFSNLNLLNTVLTPLGLVVTRFHATLLFSPANDPTQHFEQNGR